MLNLCLCFKRGDEEKPRHCKIVLLDETHMIHEVQESTRGQDLLELVCRHLNLIETAYFGLRYVDAKGQARWLNLSKKLSSEVKAISLTLYFGLKLYPMDPCKLVEEITRYQVFLQLKQDILQSRLTMDTETAIQLFAYAIQSETGDYDPERHTTGYVSELRFIANQTRDVEVKVAELHQTLAGQAASTVEMAFLEKAKWLDLYGADLHPVLGEESSEYFIALTPNAILVLRNGMKVAEYFWSQVVKARRKSKYFLLKISQKNAEEKTYGFELVNDGAAKNLLECVKDHKAFYSLTGESNTVYTSRSGPVQLGVQRRRSPPNVVRVPSRRYQRRFGQPDGADAGNKENLSDHGPGQGAQVNTNSSSLNSPSSLPVKEAQRVPIATQYDLWEQISVGHRGSNSECSAPHRHRHRSHSRSRHSDNESQVSRSSRCSRHSTSSKRSCRHKDSNNRDASSSCDTSTRKRKHRRKHRKPKSDSTELMFDSHAQWQEIQRKRSQPDTNQPHQSSSSRVTRTRQSKSHSHSTPPDQLYPPQHHVYTDQTATKEATTCNSNALEKENDEEHLYCNLPLLKESVQPALPASDKHIDTSPVLATLGSIGSRAPVYMGASELDLAFPKQDEMATEL